MAIGIQWLAVATGAAFGAGFAGGYFAAPSASDAPAMAQARCPDVVSAPPCAPCQQTRCPECQAPPVCVERACPPAQPACPQGEKCISVDDFDYWKGLFGGTKELPFRATYPGVELLFSNPTVVGHYFKVEVQNRSGRDLPYCKVTLALITGGSLVGAESTNFEHLSNGSRRVIEFIFDEPPREGSGNRTLRYEINDCTL